VQAEGMRESQGRAPAEAERLKEVLRHLQASIQLSFLLTSLASKCVDSAVGVNLDKPFPL